MFGKISDKTRREAYISAVTEANSNKAAEVSHQNFIKRSERNNRLMGRREVSGKEANDLARKELNISIKTDKRAIIEGKLANMKYYDNWRERVDGEILKEPIKDELEAKPKANDFSSFGGSNRPTFDSLDREPGIEASSSTNQNSSKKDSSRSFLDSLYPDSTLDDSSSNEEDSIFDRLFKRSQEREQQRTEQTIGARKEYETQTSFVNKNPIRREVERPQAPQPREVKHEESRSFLGVVPEMKPAPKKRGPYNKKKKIDADIIGATGFFTIT